METKLKKEDFYFLPHNNNDGTLYTKLSNNDTNHRFGGNIVRDGINFQLRPQSCGNPCSLVRAFDSWIRAINWAFDFEPQSYKESILEFDDTSKANEFIDSLFKIMKKHAFTTRITSGVLGTQYYKYLPKGFIEIRLENGKFYHYLFNKDTFEFTSFDFEPIYKKYYSENLYNYNFETKKVEPNKNHKSWL